MGEFKSGDTVVLKAGGPYMTVDEIPDRADKSVVCIWFDASAHIQQAVFLPHMLRSAFDADGNLVPHYAPVKA